MTAILKITDGTESTETNLLCLPGFQLESWRPQIAGYKGDGTFQSSPLAPGRQLVNKQFDNIIETFQFKAKDVSQDALIEDVQNLVRMLEKATSYWSTDWQDVPVYIEAKATEETNTRYGHIMSYRIPELENPYDQPFLQRKCESVMDNLTLIIEHTPWTENVPSVGTAVEVSAVETYDSRNLGNVDSAGTRVPTTANEVYIANKRNEANLTDIYVDDGGVFGANLMDAALPFNFLPAVPAVGDAIYFGIDTSIADSGPFSSLVFDIGIAGDGYTGRWEYAIAGPGFNPFIAQQIQDNTDGGTHAFENTGVNSVHFYQPPIWVTATINGVTGYWVRYVILTTPGPLISPTQQNRDIYSVTWPYAEIQDTAVLGDIVALSKIQLYNQSANTSITNELSANRYIMGLRSVFRGENFTSHINIADEQNPSGITVAAVFAGAFATNVEAPSGRVINATPAATLTDIAQITFDSTISSEYYGQYHMFMRAEQVGGSVGDITLKITASIQNGIVQFFESSIVSPEVIGLVQLLDFGKFVFPAKSGLPRSEVYDNLRIEIQAARTSTPTLILYDLILIPVDEWSADTKTATGLLGGSLENGDYLEVDSITVPKLYVYTHTKDGTTNAVLYPYLLITSGISILQSNARQRLWLISEGVSGSDKQSEFSYGVSCLISKNQQYITMRGDR